uniref:ShKT domain-containing protein n=1 Tax=Caenorhabditis tropicalis TaxID=1561998 RepID=A0A1I7T7A7_9PELO
MWQGRCLPLLAFLIGLSGVQSSGLDCDSTTYLECQTDLNKALSIADPQPWFDPENFRKEVETYYQNQGPDGIRKVCKAFREFKVCMGDQYANCMSPVHFVSVSATPFNAYQFVGLFNQMHFVCGAGLQTYLSNEGCMSQTWRGNSGQQLTQCRLDYEVTSDVAAEQACTLANKYLICFETQFKNSCGDKSNDAQFWACEYSRVNIFTRFPQCAARCVLPYTGGIIG